MLLSGFALSGAAMFLLVRSLTRHTGAALVAGFVFAFLPYRYMHYAHLELQMAQWMPLTLWALHRTFSARARCATGCSPASSSRCQTLSSFYYGIFFATFLVPVGLALLLGDRARRASGRHSGRWASARCWPRCWSSRSRGRTSRRGSRWGSGRSPRSSSTARVPQDYLVAHPRNMSSWGRSALGRGSQERELFQGCGHADHRHRRAVAADVRGADRVRRRAGARVRALARHQRAALPVDARAPAAVPRACASRRGWRSSSGWPWRCWLAIAVARISRAGSSRAAQLAAVVVIALPIAAEYRSPAPASRDAGCEPAPVYETLAGAARRPCCSSFR